MIHCGKHYPSITDILARLTQAEQALPLSVNTLWEGSELMRVSLVAVLRNEREAFETVCLMYNVCEYTLKQYTVLRLLFIPSGQASSDLQDMASLSSWSGCLEVWD